MVQLEVAAIDGCCYEQMLYLEDATIDGCCNEQMLHLVDAAIGGCYNKQMRLMEDAAIDGCCTDSNGRMLLMEDAAKKQMLQLADRMSLLAQQQFADAANSRCRYRRMPQLADIYYIGVQESNRRQGNKINPPVIGWEEPHS